MFGHVGALSDLAETLPVHCGPSSGASSGWTGLHLDEHLDGSTGQVSAWPGQAGVLSGASSIQSGVLFGQSVFDCPVLGNNWLSKDYWVSRRFYGASKSFIPHPGALLGTLYAHLGVSSGEAEAKKGIICV